jgi:DNA-binding response OmpR family regulator
MKKVLVIDDTPEIPMIIAESLNLYGFTTLAAEDGVTGIQIAREQVPDLIICDINMPKLDGYATLTAIRQDETTSTIPFIFLSGATEKISVRRGMEMGADDYLTKPFTHKELVSAVNTRLEKQAEMQRHSDKKLDELRGNITLALPHELRTPLNGILGLASLMMDNYAKLPPEEVLESDRELSRVLPNRVDGQRIEKDRDRPMAGARCRAGHHSGRGARYRQKIPTRQRSDAECGNDQTAGAGRESQEDRRRAGGQRF